MERLFLTKNTCYRRNEELADSRYEMFRFRGPIGVMIHSTGADNPNLRRYIAPDDGVIGKNDYGNHWNQPGIEACVHAFIGKDKEGKVRAYQTLPWNFRGWHCARSGNDTHVSIEVCEDDRTDAEYLRKCYLLLVEVIGDICTEYGLDPMAAGVLIDHAEGNARGIASDHDDITSWFKRFNVTMDMLRRDVAKYMKGETAMNEQEVKRLVDQAVGKAISDLTTCGKRYNKIAEVPDFYRPELDYLIERGYLKGRGGSGEDRVLDLSEDGVRMLVVQARRFMEQDASKTSL